MRDFHAEQELDGVLIYATGKTQKEADLNLSSAVRAVRENIPRLAFPARVKGSQDDSRCIESIDWEKNAVRLHGSDTWHPWADCEYVLR